MTTRNETIERIGAGLRREIDAVVASPLPKRIRELLDRLEQLDRRTPPATASRCSSR
jgi:hypothetical protein